MVNDKSVLDGTFSDVEILKPIYDALGLLGIHILDPYHYLTMDKKSNYSTYSISASVYNKLTSVSASTSYHWSYMFHLSSS